MWKKIVPPVIPEQSHGKTWLEIVFIIIPAVLLAVIAVPTVATVIALNETDDTECVVNVTGQQWWWEYDYPVDAEGTLCGYVPSVEAAPVVTSGQMVIPTDTNVLIRGTSRDVIHSFWVPRLNGKRDMVPGRVHTLRMNADEPGLYAGQCAEFCGLSHANMRMEVIALEPDDFEAWKANQTEPYVAMEIFCPTEYTGTLMDLCQTRRGEYVDQKFLTEKRVSIKYDMPLAEVITDFFDQMKSRSKGYDAASDRDDGFGL